MEKRRSVAWDAGASTHVADALGPDSLVELHVNAHVGGLHDLLRELLHLLGSEGGARRVSRGAREGEIFGLKGVAGPGHHDGRKRLIRRRCGDSIDTNGVARTPSERVRSSAASSTPIGGRHARRRRASRATPTPSPNRGSNAVFWDGTHRLHRTRSPLLEGQSVDRLGEVDGVLAGHDVLSLAHVSRCCAGRIRRAKRARRARCFGKNTSQRSCRIFPSKL